MAHSYRDEIAAIKADKYGLDKYKSDRSLTYAEELDLIREEKRKREEKERVFKSKIVTTDVLDKYITKQTAEERFSGRKIWQDVLSNVEKEKEAKKGEPFKIGPLDKSKEKGSFISNIPRATGQGVLKALEVGTTFMDWAYDRISEDKKTSTMAGMGPTRARLTEELSPNRFTKNIEINDVIGKYVAKTKDPVKKFFDMNETYVKTAYDKLAMKRLGEKGAEKVINDTFEAFGGMIPSMLMAMLTYGGSVATQVAMTQMTTAMKYATLAKETFKPSIPFMTIASGRYLKNELDKGTDPYTAMLLSTYKGGVEGMTEAIPFNMLMANMGIKQGGKIFLAGVKNRLIRMPLAQAKVAFVEGLQEAVVEPFLKIGDVMIGGEKSPALLGKGGYIDLDTMLESGLYGIGLGGLMGMFGLPVTGINIAKATKADKINMTYKLADYLSSEEGQTAIEKAKIPTDRTLEEATGVVVEPVVKQTQPVAQEAPVKQIVQEVKQEVPVKEAVTTAKVAEKPAVAEVPAKEEVKAGEQVLVPTEKDISNDILIDDRTYTEVGSQKVKAYQFLHPELKTEIQGEAKNILFEFRNIVKGERFPIMEETMIGMQPSEKWSGTKKSVSDSIAKIQETTNASYAEIKTALQKIVDDYGVENNALSKRIELVIDENLTYGVEREMTGKQEPNTDYIAKKQKIIGEEPSAIQEEAREEEGLPIPEDDFAKVITPKESQKLQDNITELTKYEQMLKDNKFMFGGLVSETERKAFSDFLDVKLKKYRQLLEHMQEKKMTKADIAEVKKLIKTKETDKTLKAEFKAKERERIEKDKLKKEQAKQREADNKLLKSLKHLAARTNYLRPEFKVSAQKLLAEFDITAKSMTSKKKFQLQSLRDEMDALHENDSSYTMPDDIAEKLKRLERTSISQMTVELKQDLQDVVDHIINENKNTNKLIDENRVVEGKKAVEETVKEIGTSDIIEDKVRGKVLDLFNGTLGEILKWKVLQPRRLLASAVNWNFASPFVEWTATALSNGTERMLNYERDATRLKSEGFKNVDHKLYKKKTIYTFENGKFNLSRAELLDIYMHSLNETNRSNLTDAKEGGARTDRRRAKIVLTEKDLSDVKGMLTKTDLQIIAVAIKYFEEMSKPAINETSLDVDGFERAREPNYYHMNKDPIARNRNLNKFFGHAGVESRGEFKERTGAINPLMIESIFDVIDRSIDHVAKYYGYARALRNAKMIAGNEKINTALKQKYGHTKHIDAIESLIKKIEQPRLPSEFKTVRFLDKLVSNIQKSILSINLSIAAVQGVSIMNAGAYLDPKYFPASQTRKIDKQKQEDSASYIWYRHMGFSTREVGEAQKLKTTSNAPSKGTAPIRYVDGKTIDAIWKWAEEQIVQTTGLKEGSDDLYKAVGKTVTDIIKASQPNYTMTERPELQRSDNLVLRLLMMFTTQRLQNYGMMYEGIVTTKLGIKNKDSKQTKQGLRTTASVTASILVYSLVKLGVSRLRKRDDSFWKELVNAVVGNVAIIGNLVTSFINGYNNNNIVDQALGDLLDSLKNLNSSFKTTPGNIRQLVVAISQLSGLPTKNILRDTEAGLNQIDPYLSYEWSRIWIKEPDYKISPEAQKIKDGYSKIKKKYDKLKEKGQLTVEVTTEYNKYKTANTQINNYRNELEAIYTRDITTESKRNLVKEYLKLLNKVVETFD